MWNRIVFLIGLKVQDTFEGVQEHTGNLMALTAYLQNEFPNVTLQEVERAYTLGVKGELSEIRDGNIVPMRVFQTLNPLQVSAVIGAYLRYKRGQLAGVVVGELFEVVEEREPTEEEMNQKYLEILQRAFEVVGGGESYQDWGNVLYDALDKRGLVYFSTEEKWQFMELAKGKKLREANERANESLHTVFYRAAEKAVQAMREGNYNGTDVKMIAKTLALNALINEQIETGWSAEEFWNSVNSDSK